LYASGVAQSAKVIWTYSDLELMAPDGRRHEILNGEWIVTPAPTTIHQTVSKRVHYELMRQLELAGHGVVFYAPVDVIFSQTRVTEPDLLVVRTSRRNIISERGIEGAPDLIIEILSPTNERNDREIKRKLYADERVPEYWLVDPRTHTIEVLVLAGAEYELKSTFRAGDTARSVGFPFSVGIDGIFE
jgi:Uma2 family endonuclease